MNGEGQQCGSSLQREEATGENIFLDKIPLKFETIIAYIHTKVLLQYRNIYFVTNFLLKNAYVTLIYTYAYCLM